MGWFSPSEAAILKKRVVRLSSLVEMDFKTETRRVWNGDRWLKFNGHLWQPMFGQGIIDGIPIMTTGTIESVNLSLNGIPSAALGLALADRSEVAQRPMKIYFLFRDPDWQPLFAKIAFYGFMQPPRITQSGAGLRTVSVECMNAFFNRSLPPFGRYNYTDQVQRHPGDEFFSHQGQLTYKVIKGYP